MAQIRQVVSESLQATIRRLLPSQQGFTEDLQASNVIQPIIDLTPTAEGSQLPVDLARSFSFDDVTSFTSNNSTVVIANSPGFYKILAAFSLKNVSSGNTTATIQLSDGLTTKKLFEYVLNANGDHFGYEHVEFEVYLTAGDSVSAITNGTRINIIGSVRQIADVNGNIVNPAGYTGS